MSSVTRNDTESKATAEALERQTTFTSQEIEALVATDIKDPTTWPQVLKDEMAEQQGRGTEADDWEDWRQLALDAAIDKELRPWWSYVAVLCNALYSRLPENGQARHLLRKLDDAFGCLVVIGIDQAVIVANRAGGLLPATRDDLLTMLTTPGPEEGQPVKRRTS